MAHDRSNLILISRSQINQTAIHSHFSTRHCKSVGIALLKNHKLPVRTGQIDLGNAGNPLTNFLNHLLVGFVGGDLFLLLHFYKLFFRTIGQVFIRKHGLTTTEK